VIPTSSRSHIKKNALMTISPLVNMSRLVILKY
jgi:hypothetical protein